MLFFYFKKTIYFGFFLFSKKFIINDEKIKIKTNNLNYENKLFLSKSQKNKYEIFMNFTKFEK